MKLRKYLLSPILSAFYLGLTYGNQTNNIDEITVSATRQEISVSLSPVPVNVLSNNRISDFSRRDNLRDLFLFEPSLFIFRTEGGRDLIGIRGFFGERVLLLIDGRRLSGEASGAFEIDRITLDRVDRVEILKGPASVLYGTDALGGVINIITKEPLKTEISYSTKYGNFSSGGNPIESNLAFSFYTGRFKNFNFGVFGRRTESDEYRVLDMSTLAPSRRLNSFGISAFYYLSEDNKSKIRFDYDYLSHTDTGNTFARTNNNQLQLRRVIDDNDRRNYSLSIDLNSELSRLFLRSYLSTYNKSFENRREDNLRLMNFDQSNRNIYVLEGFFSKDILDVHRFTLGGEYRKENFKATRLTRGKIVETINKEGLHQNMREVSIDYVAVYLQYEAFLSDKLFLIAGSRYDDSNIFEGNFSPRIGFRYDLQGYNLKANYSRGFRTPSPRDLYIFTQQSTYWTVGNPNLKSEKTSTVDISLEKTFSNKHFIKAELFYTDAKDFIDREVVCFGGNPNCSVNDIQVPRNIRLETFRNVNKANLYGIEFNSLFKPSDIYRLRLGYTYLQAKDDQTGQRLLQRPEHRALVEGQFTPNNHAKLSAIAEYVSGILLNNNPKLEKDYMLLYLSGSYRLTKWFEIYGGVDNLTDKKDRDLPLLGRFYYAGVRGSF